jgi:predicted MFS family arabinose efflux permease
MANLTGRLADRGLAQLASGAGAAVLVVSWAALAAGAHSLAWFLIGMVAVDLALQAVHISNQSIVYALAPAARSRINAVYMTTYFIGAAAGSALGALAWTSAGWTGVCLFGVAAAAATALVWLVDLRVARRAVAVPA